MKIQCPRRRFLLASWVVAPLIGACAARERSTQILVAISQAGNYLVNGEKVRREELEATLASMKPTGSEFRIHFHADPSAQYESVRFAMEIAQRLGAQIGIVGSAK
jgi:biopolymer transport protein ExbD